MNISSLAITHEILLAISEVDEFKGAWKTHSQLPSEQLTALKCVADIESIGASTRIEGGKLSDLEIDDLLGNLLAKRFVTTDEQEAAGYAEVLNKVLRNHSITNLTESYIQQLHSELMQYSPKDDWHRGQYKKSNNHIEARDIDGDSLGVVFETTAPDKTEARMKELINWTTLTFAEKKLHPVLTTAIFVADFLAIHPFQDGNGRLSRLLTTYLLLKSGYAYVPYSSLEAILESNKETYYVALRQTQTTLQSDAPNWQPWVTFFVKSLKEQKRKLERKIENERLLLTRLPLVSQQIVDLIKSRGRITIGEVEIISGINRNTLKKHLEALSNEHQIQKHGTTKGAWYTLKSV